MRTCEPLDYVRGASSGVSGTLSATTDVSSRTYSAIEVVKLTLDVAKLRAVAAKVGIGPQLLHRLVQARPLTLPVAEPLVTCPLTHLVQPFPRDRFRLMRRSQGRLMRVVSRRISVEKPRRIGLEVGDRSAHPIEEGLLGGDTLELVNQLSLRPAEALGDLEKAKALGLGLGIVRA